MKSTLLLWLKTIGLLLASFILLVMFINSDLFDEELNPDAAALLQPTQLEFSRDNGYFLLMGFDAAADKDPIDAGIGLVKQLGQNLINTGRHDLSESNYDQWLGDKAERLVGYGARNIFIPSCSSPRDPSCIPDTIKALKAADFKIEQDDSMVLRYKLIKSLPHYQELNHGRYETPLPSYGLLTSTSRFFLFDSYINQSSEQFISDIEADIILWKKILRESTYLITKMVATARLRENFHLLIAASSSLSEDNLSKLNLSLTQLTPDELQIDEAFAFEFMLATRSFQANNASLLDVTSTDDIKEHLLLTLVSTTIQPNAITNWYYREILQRLPLIAKAEASELNNITSQLSLELKSAVAPTNSITTLYNPMGKTLQDEGTLYAYRDYIARVHDLNNLIVMSRLALEIRLNDDSSMMDIVQQSKNKNLLNDKPFEFDIQKQTLSYECLDQGYSDPRYISRNKTPRQCAIKL
ncbi:MAG: hypothetical protein V2I33_11675 [Kangiellaceae bacterium]|jgi:hypothetical protein|nr:hypothetical protein [Kangiellaceae bacterium]